MQIFESINRALVVAEFEFTERDGVLVGAAIRHIRRYSLKSLQCLLGVMRSSVEPTPVENLDRRKVGAALQLVQHLFRLRVILGLQQAISLLKDRFCLARAGNRSSIAPSRGKQSQEAYDALRRFHGVVKPLRSEPEQLYSRRCWKKVVFKNKLVYPCAWRVALARPCQFLLGYDPLPLNDRHQLIGGNVLKVLQVPVRPVNVDVRRFDCSQTKVQPRII